MFLLVVDVNVSLAASVGQFGDEHGQCTRWLQVMPYIWIREGGSFDSGELCRLMEVRIQEHLSYH